MWTKIGSGDYSMQEDSYKLRVERVQDGLWWWAIYKDDKLVVSTTDLDHYEDSRKEAFAAVLAVYMYITLS